VGGTDKKASRNQKTCHPGKEGVLFERNSVRITKSGCRAERRGAEADDQGKKENWFGYETGVSGSQVNNDV